MEKCLVIINPVSGIQMYQKNLNKILGDLILKHVVRTIDSYYTKGIQDAYHYAKKHLDENYDFIIVVGGDGTINEVVHALVETGNKTPIVIIAAGSTNDFATYMDLPTHGDEIVEMIENFKTIQCDVGKMNDHYFLNIMAMGMFNKAFMDASEKSKKYLGPMAYYVNAIKNLPETLSMDVMNLKFTCEGIELEQDAKAVFVSNTGRISGYEHVSPYASVHDGVIDVLIIKDCSLTDLIAIAKDYSLHKHLESPFISFYQTKALKIEGPDHVMIDVDGENAGTLPAEISVINHAITLVVQ